MRKFEVEFVSRTYVEVKAETEADAIKFAKRVFIAEHDMPGYVPEYDEVNVSELADTGGITCTK